MVTASTMGENDDAPIDEKVIKKTQDTLGKLIKAPPLTDKLLSRPPFRFLHDVITAVMKSTGFLKNLHTESDLRSDNVKEKDQKIAFLQKTIDFVELAFVIGRPLSTNPLKVVAGKDPVRTNEFLQCLAEGANKKVDNDVMVKRFLSGEKLDASSSKAHGQSKPSKHPPTQQTNDKREGKEKAKDKHRENGLKSSAKDERRQKEPSPDRPADTTVTKNRPREAGRDRGNMKKSTEGDDSEGEAAAPESRTNRRLTRPPSARGRQNSGVPGTRTVPDQPHDQNKSGKITKPSSAEKPKIVIQKATKENDSDEEDEFVVREAGPGAAPTDTSVTSANAMIGEGEDQHGALVQKIIDTTKALDAKTGAKTKKMSAAEEAALRRQRETVSKEMEKLCNAVQASARLAAPLARLSELVQEDLDAMNTELQMWRSEHRKAVAQITETSKKGRKQSDFTTASASNEALRGQLLELDSQVSEMSDAVAAVRGNCMRNEQRIASMLGGNNK